MSRQGVAALLLALVVLLPGAARAYEFDMVSAAAGLGVLAAATARCLLYAPAAASLPTEPCVAGAHTDPARTRQGSMLGSRPSFGCMHGARSPCRECGAHAACLRRPRRHSTARVAGVSNEVHHGGRERA